MAVDYLRRQNPAGASVLSMMTGWLETSLRGSYTPVYASPQQRAGQPPDPRDDVHALGVIAFHMMTGRLTESPGIDAAEDLQDAGASSGFIGLVTKCVASKPDRRPKDAAELADRLAELLKGEPKTTSAAKPAVPTPAAKTPPQPLPQGERGSGTPPASPPSFSGKGVGGLGSSTTAPTALEGGAPTVAPHAAPAAAPDRWVIPLRGQWFTRPAADPEAGWTPSPVKLPGEVAAKPGECYRLALSPDGTTDADLAKLRSLSGLPGLEAVDLSGCRQVTDAGLMHLAQLRGLKAVGLADTQVTDSGVTLLLTRFPDLEAVGLAGATRVTQTVVPYLTRLRKLRVLALPPRADTIDVRVEFSKRRPACKLV